MCAAIINSLNRGLILDLPLNGQVRDRSPAGNNGVKTGFTFNNGSVISGATWIDGKFAGHKGISFDGSTGVINFGDVTTFDNMSGITIQYWAKPDDYPPSTTYHMAGKESSFFSYLQTNGTVGFNVGNSGGWLSSTVTSGLLVSGTWSNVACTYDYTNGVTIYINGVNNGSNASGGFLVPDTARMFSMGAYDSNGSALFARHFKGDLSNVRIYNRALNIGEIGSEMNSPIAVAGSGLVGCWECAEGHGTIAYDTNDTVKGPWSESKAMATTGSIEYINAGDITALNSATNFSISSWVKQDTITKKEMIFSKGDSTTEMVAVYTWTDNRIYVDLRNGTNSSWSYVTGYNNIVSAGVPFHTSLVFDGAGATDADKYKFYINGASQTLTFNTSAVTSTGAMSGKNLYVGHSDLGGSTEYNWNGTVNNFKVHNRALSALEVKSLYETSKGGYLK